MHYKVLRKNLFEKGEYKIVPFRKEDMFKIMDWRNLQMDVLRQAALITEPLQQKYYNDVITPSFNSDNPSLILFSFLKNNECIGYGGLTNIDYLSKKAEMSYLVNPERIEDEELYTQETSAFISMIKEVIFDDLKFDTLFTETYDIRPNHIKTLELNGFKLKSRIHDNVEIRGEKVDSLIHEVLRTDA